MTASETQSLAIENAEETGAVEARSPSELRFELGLWVRGLENFCSIGKRAFNAGSKTSIAGRNYRSELHITQAVLIKCSELTAELHRNASAAVEPVEADVVEIEKLIKTLLTLNVALVRQDSINFAEWNAWCEMLTERVKRAALYAAFDEEFSRSGEEFLPDRLKNLLVAEHLSKSDRRDLHRFVPRFGGILRSLDLVGQMLRDDVPLRSSLAIFAFVYEAVEELIFDINNRLSRHADETAEIFGLLDAASYTLSIESKKAFSHELSAILGIRSATAVYARVESAYGVLNDNLRQLLAGFARLAEPGIAAIDIFPDFHTKLEKSLELRARLFEILTAVRQAEAEPKNKTLAELRNSLRAFLTEPVSFLFYKDRETVERFCNEIEITHDETDAGPVLHRFSAYLETLFNQVGMRAVLSNHPFDPHQK